VQEHAETATTSQMRKPQKHYWKIGRPAP
jgi:hypothetical protein